MQSSMTRLAGARLASLETRAAARTVSRPSVREQELVLVAKVIIPSAAFVQIRRPPKKLVGMFRVLFLKLVLATTTILVRQVLAQELVICRATTLSVGLQTRRRKQRSI